MESNTLISGGLFPLNLLTSDITNHEYCFLTMPLPGTMFDTHSTDSETPPFKGSMVVIQATSAEKAREIVSRDVYAQNGVWDLENAQIYPVSSSVACKHNVWIIMVLTTKFKSAWRAPM